MKAPYTFDGRPCWIACDVGRELGYSNHGHEFVAQLRRKWHDEIANGEEVRTLRKRDLQRFMTQNPQAAELHYKAPRLVILYELGLRLAVARSNKPAAKALRRALLDTSLEPEPEPAKEPTMPSTALTLFDHTFENAKITTIIYKGRPCWVAMDVGKAIGYTGSGKGFVEQLRGEWSDEMVEGHDFVSISGEELSQFREVADVVGESPSTFAHHLLVLFESGLWLALAKTRQRAGKRLRRFLVERVIPQLMRDGRYLPQRKVTPQGAMVEREYEARMRALDIEEQRLNAQLRDLDMRERQTKATALVTLVDSLPYLSDDIRQAYRVKAAEEVTGHNLAGLLPPAAESLSWASPTQIGERLGVHPNAVGKAVTALGLRGADGLSRAIVNKARHSDRTVTSYLYSPEAVNQLAAYLRQ